MWKTRTYSATEEISIDQKNFLGLTVMLLLALNFTLSYLAFTYYPNGLLDAQSPGFWITAANYSLITGIVVLNKKIIGWQWSDLGLGRIKSWWKTVVVGMAVFTLLLLFSQYIQPHIFDAFGQQHNVSHLSALEGDLPRLIGTLIFVWITAGLLEELVFRAFLINTLDVLLGSTIWSTMAAVIISSLIFGMVHSYQGVTGILVTTCIGLIFGVAYVLGGRKIWPLIFIHGHIDTITLISFYRGTF
ncbi:CPBP family intramembrane glutamic endopeptidase [Salinimicrobium oceani]|uniref:CPBP family intramembrane metalloprotease n=1 Tax=Salinimicrobium oceani TaxID=2722702 RepID=A0ABX1CXS3_9FLAO|nr:type II CAAX endopeptidase family protein [Salinimicrobium oceani]NJW53058.1 CPBP family intramembrane metalloprotease [Salinimicrobium oceani]